MLRWIVVAVTLGCAPTQAPRASAPPPAQKKIETKPEKKEEPPPEDRKTAIANARAKIEAARAAVDEAVVQIKSKETGEAELASAKAAADALKAAIDEGSRFESGDLGYIKFSLEARRSYRLQRDVIEKRTIEVGVAIGRADIERSLADMNSAMNRLKSKDVVDEEFDLARTSVDAVLAALAKHEPMAKRNGKFAAYVAQVKARATKKAIDDRQLRVAIDRQRARIEEGRKVIADALAQSDLERAEQAIASTRKLLDEGKGLGAKDREYHGYAFQVAKRMDESTQKIAALRLKAEVQAQWEKLRLAVNEMKQSVSNLPGPDDISLAENAISIVEKTIDEGRPLTAKDANYAWFAGEGQKAADQARAQVERRKLEAAIAERKAAIEELLAVAKSTVENASDRDATSKEIAAATSAAKAVRDAIAKGAPLEQRDRKYAAFAASAIKQLERTGPELERAQQMVTLREGTRIAESVVESMSLEQQKGAYAKAIEILSSCEAEECAEQKQSIDAKLSAVKARLAFYDGPAKSFERAKALLAGDKQSEALGQFESCLETGKILQYKHPALAKEQLKVGGKSVTLPAVVADCQQQAKALRAKIQHAKK